MFKKVFLSEVRMRAIRKGVWYRVLDRLERGILTLASRVVDEVHDTVLGVELVKIIAKIRDATASRFVRHVETFGVSRAREIVAHAKKLAGLDWLADYKLSRYLAFLDFNQSIGWGSTRCRA
jgi:hypothetical protein